MNYIKKRSVDLCDALSRNIDNQKKIKTHTELKGNNSKSNLFKSSSFLSISNLIKTKN